MLKALTLLIGLTLSTVSMSLTYEEQFQKDWKCGKGKRWCQRVNSCVKKCAKCKAPYVIGDRFYCTKLNYCKAGEKCVENSCIGVQYGKEYVYKPHDIDPCLNHN